MYKSTSTSTSMSTTTSTTIKEEEPGKLTLVCGPMFSGKTSHLISTYKENSADSIVINFCDDNRYSKTLLSNHDKVMIPCIKLKQLYDLETMLEFVLFKDAIKTIFIDEGQFYEDLVPQVLKFLEVHKKNVFVYGLDSDFRRERFGTLLDLIPHTDEFVHLKANCNMCGGQNNATYSQRVTNEQNIVVIGSSNYIPLCRKCYIKSI